MNNRHLMMTFLVFGAMSLAMACGDLDLDACDPDVDDDCVCTLDFDEDVDVTEECFDGQTDDGEPCSCAFTDDFFDSEGDENDERDEDRDEDDDAGKFRFVMVEDMTTNRGGDYPGSDIDAISLIKSSGGELFAQTLEEDSDVDCLGNFACDPTAVLGAPDAVTGGSCFGGGAVDEGTFTALNGGFVIVGFGSETIQNGDSLHVYEVGSTECGRFDDDPYRVSVSVSDTVTGSFVELGTGGNGSNIIPVSGLR